MSRSAEKIMVLQPREAWADIRLWADEGRIQVNISAQDLHLSGVRRLALIVDSERVVAVSLARRIRRSGAFDYLVQFDQIRAFDPLPISELLADLPAGFSSRWENARFWNSILPKATGREVVAALGRLRRGISSTIAELQDQLAPRKPASEPAILNAMEQRDAVAVGLELANIDSRAVLGEDEPVGHAPFLSGVAGNTQESAVLRHDAARFADWMEAQSDHFDVTRFQDPRDSRRVVSVFYADKGPLEVLTGTDLIYYREDTGAFVLVQYKRMVDEGRELLYRPDSQLEVEIERMMKLKLPLSQATSVAAWRLSVDPFYIKLVEPSIRRPRGNRFAVGMYFPLELFQLVLASPEAAGPKGGIRVGWNNAQRYMTNGQFLALVQESMIGTRGDATKVLEQLISRTLSSGRAAIVVSDETDYSKVAHRRS